MTRADEEIHERWQEFQKRCQAEEARIVSVRAVSPGEEANQSSDREQRQHLRELEAQYERRLEQLQREQQEFSTMKEQWVQDQTQVQNDVGLADLEEVEVDIGTTSPIMKSQELLMRQKFCRMQ